MFLPCLFYVIRGVTDRDLISGHASCLQESLSTYTACGCDIFRYLRMTQSYVFSLTLDAFFFFAWCNETC
jgi:hypothetical protein